MNPKKKFNKNNKARAQRFHARFRAQERYNLKYNRNDLQFIRKEISEGKAELVRVQSCRVSHYKIEIRDQSCWVVYDHHRQEVVTFLPPTFLPPFETQGVPEAFGSI